MGSSSDSHGDNAFMALALAQAEDAAAAGEVPVGAVVVHQGQVIAQDRNRREQDHDPLAHAEILVLRAAAQVLGRWRLTGCTLYVSLEPCVMCAGAVVNARLDRLVFGASDARGGAVGSLMNVVQDLRLNHRATVVGGVQAEAAADLLQRFFAARRAQARVDP